MSFTTEKVIHVDSLNQVHIKKYISTLHGNILNISEIRTDKNDQEIEVLIMQQPWKCHPDGSRENFTTEEDAAAWLESVKDSFLS